MTDDELIERTLQLAERGKGRVSPNPLVGCVIVKDGNIIGEGWHREFGGKHAEVDAFDNCSQDPEGASLYVNLEPCSHFGKTPPCTDLIISKKIARVVIGTGDPNPLVNGKGIQKLRDAGITVDFAGSSSACEELNKFFFKSVRIPQPYILIKAAQTIDGKIADKSGESKWLSGEESRNYVHRLRSEYDAVMIGINTVKTDEPSLSVRNVEGRDPHIIVIDKNLEISPGAKIFSIKSDRKIFIITSDKNRQTVPPGLPEKVAKFIFLREDKSGNLPVSESFTELIREGIISVMVEGGAGIYSYLISNGLYDELMIFYTPKLLGSGVPVFSNPLITGIKDSVNLRLHGVKRFGDDILADYRRF